MQDAGEHTVLMNAHRGLMQFATRRVLVNEVNRTTHTTGNIRITPDD